MLTSEGTESSDEDEGAGDGVLREAFLVEEDLPRAPRGPRDRGVSCGPDSAGSGVVLRLGEPDEARRDAEAVGVGLRRAAPGAGLRRALAGAAAALRAPAALAMRGGPRRSPSEAVPDITLRHVK